MQRFPWESEISRGLLGNYEQEEKSCRAQSHVVGFQGSKVLQAKGWVWGLCTPLSAMLSPLRPAAQHLFTASGSGEERWARGKPCIPRCRELPIHHFKPWSCSPGPLQPSPALSACAAHKPSALFSHRHEACTGAARLKLQDVRMSRVMMRAPPGHPASRPCAQDTNPALFLCQRCRKPLTPLISTSTLCCCLEILSLSNTNHISHGPPHHIDTVLAAKTSHHDGSSQALCAITLHSSLQSCAGS